MEISESRKAMQAAGGESEQSIQATFFEWVDLHKTKFPELDLFYAIPNAAKRGKMDGWIMKLTGTRKGVPDVHLPVPFKGKWGAYDVAHNGLWFEFKSAKGVVSPEQKVWIAKLQAAGHYVEVVRSWTDAANTTIEYLGLPLQKL